MSDNAQLFTGVHDTPAYTRLFNRSTRVWVAAPVVLGGVSTPVLAAVNLDSGNARSIVIIGVLITAVLTGLGALVPRSRPNMAFRAKAHRASIRPKLQSSTDTALLAPPNDIIDNLWFAANGNVYACYLVAGLPYHLRSLRKRSAVADLHAILARELPADSYLYGLHVPQDQRQLLRAMVHDHRDQAAWVNSCMQMAPEIARQNPATRLYVLAVPVDSGRAGHNPVGQATKVKDWIAGRDKDSDSSLQAYQNLAYDVASSIPPQFSPLPATADMLDWFWRHNAWLGTFNEPLPRRRQQQRQPQRISGAALPQAQFDEGDQATTSGAAAMAALLEETGARSQPAADLSRQLPRDPAGRRRPRGRHRLPRLGIPFRPRRSHRCDVRLRHQPHCQAPRTRVPPQRPRQGQRR
jgi:hypothetical protein